MTKFYKNAQTDKRPIVIKQIEATTDPRTRRRLQTVLEFRAEAEIELQLEFYDGVFDDDSKYEPSSVMITVQAVHPRWINLPSDTFRRDEIPLLVRDLAEDGLLARAFAEYQQRYTEKIRHLDLEMEEEALRLQTARNLLIGDDSGVQRRDMSKVSQTSELGG